MSESVSQERLQQLWNRTIDEIKKGDVNLPLWEAVEACVPVTFEDLTLVLGMRTEDYHRSGHLKNPASAHLIREVLARIVGKKAEFDIIEGIELSHWEMEKQRRKEREDAARRAMRRDEAEATGGLATWDDVSAYLQQLFSKTKDRSLPWVAAQYMLEAIAVVAEIEERQRANPSADPHLIDRGVARMLQRISGQVENVPLPILGLEYLRYKRSREG